MLAPDSALAHNTVGEAALAEGNVDEAKASFTKALELDANTAEAHAGLAEIHFQGEEYAAAADSATKALELSDQLTRAYGIRGKANNALGKSNEAQADLSMAITVNPDDPGRESRVRAGPAVSGQQRTGRDVLLEDHFVESEPHCRV